MTNNIRILLNRTVVFEPEFGQKLRFDDGTIEFDKDCTQTTPILTAERYNGRAAKRNDGTWTHAPGNRNHDYVHSLLGFAVGITYSTVDSDGKAVYDYSVITPTGVEFHGNEETGNVLRVPSHWSIERVAAEAIAWMCIGEDSGTEFPSDTTPEQWDWIRSTEREIKSAEIDEWLENYDRRATPMWPDAVEEAAMTKGETIADRAKLYSTEYIKAYQTGLVTFVLGIEDNSHMTWEDAVNLYPDPSDWDAEKVCAYLRDELDTDWHTLIDCDYGQEEGVNFHDLAAEELYDEDVDILRQHITDHAKAAEVYEWWLVDEWLATELEAEDEVTLTDGFNHWWGRCTFGQSILTDGILQKIAAKYVE